MKSEEKKERKGKTLRLHTKKFFFRFFPHSAKIESAPVHAAVLDEKGPELFHGPYVSHLNKKKEKESTT